MMKRCMIALLVVFCAKTLPAAKITLTGEIRDLNAAPLNAQLTAVVTKRNGSRISSNAVTNPNRDAAGNLLSNTYTVTFSDLTLSSNDKLVNVVLSAAGREDVSLLGLDGTSSTSINIIMPKAEPKHCGCPCCSCRPYTIQYNYSACRTTYYAYPCR